tara:strand:+ start:243 stop:446 length:204 start_codon:yes stop_codon:yes gene_type:complete
VVEHLFLLQRLLVVEVVVVVQLVDLLVLVEVPEDQVDQDPMLQQTLVVAVVVLKMVDPQLEQVDQVL